MRLRLLVLTALPLTALGAGLFYTAATGPARAQPPASQSKKPDETFTKEIAPVVEKFCLKCHSGAKPRSGFALDTLKHDAEADRKTWEKVIRAIGAREMPPEDKPQPSAVERDRLLTYVHKQLAVVDCNQGRNPGRVTVRRLNRVEYNNTIRDLLGVAFQPADDFPTDDVGYGFDNIGDVLTMSPLLMEKYLAAAERVAELALLPGTVGNPIRRYARREMLATIDAPSTPNRTYRKLESNGELYVEHKCLADGEYVLKTRAFADQAGNEPTKMALKIAGKEVRVVEVKGTSASDAANFEVRTRLKAGTHRFAAAFINDFRDDKAADGRNKDRNLYIAYLEVVSPAVLSEPESRRRIFVARPGEGLSKDDAARKIVDNLARRAFRRPVTPQEVDKYLKLIKLAEAQGESFDKGVGLALQGILVSPHFLFRLEQDKAPGDHPVNEHELATRLSYFVWSSMPDDELFRLAEAGQLRKNLEAQVRRMLADERAMALVANFAGQWLQWRNLRNLNPDTGTFPSFDNALREAMIREPELFFEAIVKEDRSILDLLDADYTFVNERLARHYDIRGVYGSRFQRVKLEGDRRGGILTMASTLTVTSNPTRTSPVKRGKWVLENVLGTPPPPPPPGAGELSEEKKIVESAPLRQRMEAHRKNPDCASCHARLDPLGFVFENYDGIGAWRNMDGKFPVDPAGSLPTGESLKGPKDLKDYLIKRKDQFARCVAEKLLTYALGRGIEYYDRCALDDIVKGVGRDGYKFSRLVLEVVQSDPFQKRRGKGKTTP